MLTEGRMVCHELVTVPLAMVMMVRASTPNALFSVFRVKSSVTP